MHNNINGKQAKHSEQTIKKNAKKCKGKKNTKKMQMHTTIHAH